jgi:hypothetical protein
MALGPRNREYHYLHVKAPTGGQVISHTKSWCRPYGSVYRGLGRGIMIGELTVGSPDGKNFFHVKVGGGGREEIEDSVDRYHELSQDVVVLMTLDECITRVRKTVPRPETRNSPGNHGVRVERD